MKDLLSVLNDQQREAVITTDGPLAIIAGAGSGKTRTVTRKVAYLIQEKKVAPERILAVAFSNKASNEMKDRIIKLVGAKANLAQISTYHSLCVRILREDIDKLGYPKRFNIIDNIDQKSILRPAYKSFGLSIKGIPSKVILDYISKQKYNKTPLDTLKAEAKSEYDKGLFNLYKFYLKSTKRTNSVDFDDLILFVERLFNENKDVVEKWSKRFDYILADEFQDTSTAQYAIIKCLSSHNNITVVGDPDQTIYSWRRANSKLLTTFKKDFKKTKEVLLIENYRSTPQILRAANTLISKNKKRVAKDLFTSHENGDEIKYFHGFSEDAEARWIVSEIQQLRKQKNQLKNIAILFRANYLSNPLEKALIKEGIDYVLFGGVRFYQRAEIKDVISYLKLINNGDEVALRRVINVPSRKIGPTTVEKLVEFNSKFNTPLLTTIVNNFNELPISSSAHQGLANFINLIRKYRIALKTHSISKTLSTFLIEIKYYATIPQGEESRIDAIKELLISLSDWEKRNPEKTLNDFLTEVSLFIDRDESDRKIDYISLMTVHTAKGLEFDNIFLFGFSEGIFPSKRALDEGGDSALEEERRLAYVAVTRAKKKLAITSSRGYNIDHTMQKKPSRFLKELGLDANKFSNNYIAPIDFNENYEKKVLIAGDKVIHEKFGSGVIVLVTGDIAEIAFKAPHGVKSMMKNHKSLKRIIG